MWQRYVRQQGYAQIRLDGRNVYGHRLAYELAHGKIPKGMCVHHVCEHKRCLNPAHLALVPRHDHAKIHGLGRHERKGRESLVSVRD